MIQKRIRSFKHAFRGIFTALGTEIHFRIHIVAAILTIVVGLVLKLNLIEWSIISICIGLVLAAELFNTAIEALCDFKTTDHHPMIKIVKDTSAAAVLILAITAVVVACLIFIPKILAL